MLLLIILGKHQINAMPDVIGQQIDTGIADDYPAKTSRSTGPGGANSTASMRPYQSIER